VLLATSDTSHTDKIVLPVLSDIDDLITFAWILRGQERVRVETYNIAWDF
jgi:hypothetical protein